MCNHNVYYNNLSVLILYNVVYRLTGTDISASIGENQKVHIKPKKGYSISEDVLSVLLENAPDS